MSSTAPLTKPNFIKVNEIRPAGHCYHVYVKVLTATVNEITRLSGDKVNIVEGTVADDSASANFHFEGDFKDLMKPGNVVAIRNGRSEVVENKIRLEIDKFGKVSVEDASTVSGTNEETNISDQVYEKRAKPARGGRRN